MASSLTMAGNSDIPAPGGGHITVVVPMFNEADCVDLFFERIEPVLDDLGGGYDIVCVDDGSSDDTVARLMAHRARNPSIKVLCLSRNFRKDIALSAGLDHAHGDAVVIIDADLQDPPELIPELHAKWREGYDVAYAARASRRSDSLAKRDLGVVVLPALQSSHGYSDSQRRRRLSPARPAGGRGLAPPARTQPLHEGPLCLGRLPPDRCAL
jgi:glycosyltransferase involved in cell wall biosynthesis